MIKKLISVLLITAGISSFITPVSVSAIIQTPAGWEIHNNGNQQLEAVIDTEEKHSGNASLRMSYKTEGGDNVYAQLRKYINVEPNTSYTYSMWVKANKINGIQTMISWGTRYGLDSLGKTYGWKKFEFSWYSGNRTQAEFQLVMNSSFDKVWIDDIKFCKEGTDTNLIDNSGFETDVVVNVPSDSTENADAEKEDYDLTAEIKSREDSGKIFLDNRYLPVLKTNNKAIDGNPSDWENEVGVTGGNADVTGTFKTAYDEKYLYLYVETPDDKHMAITEGTGNWVQDSIQFVIGSTDEMYGRQVNASFKENGPMYFYSEQWHEADYQKIKSFGTHDGTVSVYEIAIPWELTGTDYNSDNLLLNVLINDDDGAGRRYYEFAYGIGTTKINKDFIHIYCVKDKENSGFISVPSTVKTDVDNLCRFLAVNNSDEEKTFTVSTPGGKNERTVPAHGVCVEKFTVNFKESGNTEIKAGIASEQNLEIVKTVDVERSEERILSDAEKIKNVCIPELKRLIEECKAKGIPVDYEISGCSHLENYIDIVYEDMEHKLAFRADYILNSLFDIYETNKSNLEAYLSGKKEAKTAYRYVTSEHSVSGQSIFADMRNSKTGEIEKRPVYFMGYNGFGQPEPVDYLNDMGFESYAVEIGIDSLIIPPDASSGWTMLNQKAETTCKIVSEDATGSNGVLEITSKSAAEANKYLQFYQPYYLKPNTTYEFGLKAKSENVSALWFAMGGWDTERKYIDDGTYDWKSYDFEYTTSEDRTRFEFFIFLDGMADRVFIDDVYVREKGTDNNLLVNGNFEYGRNAEVYKGVKFIEEPVEKFTKILDNAAEKNISVQFQIATHYWPWFTLDGHSDAGIIGHFTGNVNYTHDRVREITEYYLKNLLEIIKDKPALGGIILGNEPGYCTMNNPGFYEPLYVEYLKYIYKGDISKLNRNYGSNYTSFEQVTFDEVRQGDTQEWLTFGIELSHIEKTPMFYDWMNFNYEVYADWATFMYNTVKKYAPDVKVHIKQLAGTWRYEHNYFRQWLRNGVRAEKLAPVTDYNGCDAQGILNNEEQSILTKMRWYDYLTSIDNAPVVNSEDHSIPDGSDNYSPEVAIWAGATVWMGALHGCSINNTWVWANDYNEMSLYGSVRVRPDAAYAQATSVMDLNRLAMEVNALTSCQAEVAVMDSLSSQAEDRIFENVSFNAWQSVIYSGQRCDFVTEKQASEGKLNQYKLIIVPKCDRVSLLTIEALRSFIANGGRVIMLGENCLENDEYGNPYEEQLYVDVKAASRIVPISYQGLAMTSPSNEEMRDMLTEEYDRLGITNVKLIDTATGKLVYDVEWESVVYDGKTIINVNNYNWNSLPTVAVEINGKRASEFTELRSGDVKNGTIELKPYEPVLISLNNQ